MSRILCSLHSILLSDTSNKESSWTPRTEPASLMILLILLASAALSLLPQPPQEIELTLALLEDSLSVLGPVQVVVQV